MLATDSCVDHTFVEGTLTLIDQDLRVATSTELSPSGIEVVKRNVPGNGLCVFCGVLETRTHIFFACLAGKFLWYFVREALGPNWKSRLVWGCQNLFQPD